MKAGPGEAARAASHAGAAAQRCDLLIVDDKPDKLLAFEAVLADLGQNLVFARSGAQALREVIQRSFAVILLDVNMPDIDGIETARLIRSHRRSAATPIIFVTAFPDERQIKQAYALGAVDYIQSPADPDVLRGKVKVFVELHLAQRRLREQADERIALAAALAAQKEAEHNERRAAYLADASRELGASLDMHAAMRRLVELVVAEAAPLAVLLLVDGALQIEDVLAGAAAEQGAPQLVVAVESRAVPQPLRAALAAALDARRRVAFPAAPLAAFAGVVFGNERALQSAAAVPLVSGRRPLGALLAGSREGWRDGGRPDGSVLEELANRAAIAFDNARLYRDLQAEIVERRNAEAGLQEANRRKDEFIAMLSHELRNPLAPIRNAVEVLRRAQIDDPKTTWAAEVLQRQVAQMSKLLDDLLDVARLSRDRMELNRQRIDLDAVVAQGLEIAQPLLAARRHELVVEKPPGPVWLHGDATRLAQVLANLLDNAGKFTDAGGRIELRVEVRAGAAHLTVRDHGIGIDARLLPHVFDLFAQGERGLDRSQGGLGVGLTLVRRIVEMHGGSVAARSDGTGRGAEFEVVLPCISLVASEDSAVALPVPAPPARGCRVLVVDDNADAAQSVALLLQFEGHEVTTLGDGEQALASAQAFAPQVVVLDIGLPVLDGYEVARRLRAMPAMREALILALSGYGQPEDRKRALESGFDEHLVKPADPQRLVELIARWRERLPAGARDARAVPAS